MPACRCLCPPHTPHSAAQVPDLHTLLIAAVDYKGQRVVAQSVIPGILHGDQSATLLHGATERRQAFKVNADFQVRHARRVRDG